MQVGDVVKIVKAGDGYDGVVARICAIGPGGELFRVRFWAAPDTEMTGVYLEDELEPASGTPPQCP